MKEHRMSNDREYKVAFSAHERKDFACTLEIKTLDEEGVFAGYASVFNIVDSQQDVILPGAFRATLTGRKVDIKLLWQHDMREPIGVVEELREDANGLYVKGRLLLEVTRAREAYTLLKRGVVSGLSIGYSPTRWKRDEKSGIRRLEALDLWEISLVTFPANAAARVTVVKHKPPQNASEERQWHQALSRGDVMHLAAALDSATMILKKLSVT